MPDVTKILSQIESGDPTAGEQLLPLVYDELRRLAANYLKQERPGQTLQPTALVHEAYLRLVNPDDRQRWDSRGHFFAAAAEAMRRILVDQARSKQALKRGGGLQRRDLAEIDVAEPQLSARLLEIDAVLQRFEELEPRKAELVKLRYFVGMTIPEVAEVLQISTATADRDWAYARAWLHAELRKMDSSVGQKS
jgi:RNA polymerase sigma factor (TIGR02999 family)